MAEEDSGWDSSEENSRVIPHFVEPPWFSSGESRGFGRGESRGFGRGRGRRGGDDRSNRRDNSNGQGGSRGRGDSDRRPGYFGLSSNSTPMIISTSDVGRLIGKNGVKIKELEKESGAEIKIEKSTGREDPGDTHITLRGSSESREKAKEMIDDFLCDVEGWGPDGFRGGRGRGFRGRKSNTRDHSHISLFKRMESDGIEPPPIDWDEINRQHDEYQKIKWDHCPKLIKDFYKEHMEVKNMGSDEVAQFRFSKMNITVNFVDECEGEIPNPVVNFEQAFSSFPDILKLIYDQNFSVPSPIQCQAWPILLSGRDLIGIAQTGTGKTLAFLLPALIHIDNQPVPRGERGGPNVLILAPTRELAQQIHNEASKYSYRGIKSLCIYGGGDRREQINALKEGVEIVVATPGRMNDLIQAGHLDVKAITYLVLDEADRMLDMGFEPDIRKALLEIRPDRQTVMTSATWPHGVRRLAKSYMCNPIQVHVGSLDLAATHTVTQLIEFLEDEQKEQRIMEFCANMGPEDKVMVFVGKKAIADDLSSELALKGIVCDVIHGGREQSDREQVLEDLKSGEIRILIATDVASRGIDINDITHIINYDFPRNIEEYVHRVGRTGRAGKTGEAITFMKRQDWTHAKDLISMMEEANQTVPDELYKMAERFQAMKEKRGRGGAGGGGRFGGGRGARNRW